MAPLRNPLEVESRTIDPFTGLPLPNQSLATQSLPTPIQSVPRQSIPVPNQSIPNQSVPLAPIAPVAPIQPQAPVVQAATLPPPPATALPTPVTETAQTTGQIFGDLIATETDQQRQLREERERLAGISQTTGVTEVDEAGVRQGVLTRFQAEIDALNQVFEERKREERLRGTGRTGTETAIQARRGLSGSDFGVAGQERVSDFNVAQLNVIRAEQTAAVQEILGEARRTATAEISGKESARRAGTEEFLSFLENQVTRQQQKVEELAQTMLTRGIEFDALEEEELNQLASDLGVDASQIRDAVLRAKQAAAPEAVKGVTLKPGDSLLDPFTGEVIGSVPPAPSNPKDPRIEKIGDKAYQWVDGQLEEIKLSESASPEKVAAAIKAVDLIDALLSEPDIDKFIGPIQGRTPALSKAKSDFKARFNTVKDLLTLDNLGLMTGVLTDRDIQLLASAATPLNLTISEDFFKGELKTIRDTLSDRAGNPASNQVGEDLRGAFEQGGFDESFDEMIRQFGEEGMKGILQQQGLISFNKVGSDTNKAVQNLTNGKTTLSIGDATITGIDGSSLWKPGLDFVLAGGKGANVASPVGGVVIAARDNAGFGKQVKIRTDDGREIWISHLDKFNVQEGQRVIPGMPVGTQGNTGNVLGAGGRSLTPQEVARGSGTHVDLTIKKPDGSFFTAREVAGILEDKRLT